MERCRLYPANCSCSEHRHKQTNYYNVGIKLTSALRGKQQVQHLVYEFHLCPLQALRKTLHGTLNSRQLERTGNEEHKTEGERALNTQGHPYTADGYREIRYMRIYKYVGDGQL